MTLFSPLIVGRVVIIIVIWELAMRMRRNFEKGPLQAQSPPNCRTGRRFRPVPTRAYQAPATLTWKLANFPRRKLTLFQFKLLTLFVSGEIPICFSRSDIIVIFVSVLILLFRLDYHAKVFQVILWSVCDNFQLRF